MNRLPIAVLLLLVCAPLAAQTRLDAGIAVGRQSYERASIGSTTLISPEVMLTRNRLALYYALDFGKLEHAGTMFASHLGVAYRLPLPRNFAMLAGAGPSYVTIQKLGGTAAFHAQAELALRTSRLEWFARVRYFDFDLEDKSVTGASPEGPAAMAGVRVSLTR